ncbi:MAG: hypothetical protein M0R73_09560 [Dehalococcoidia bacterium]|nr:hypothetical protein [Dehalococcoidia bacterium]
MTSGRDDDEAHRQQAHARRQRPGHVRQLLQALEDPRPQAHCARVQAGGVQTSLEALGHVRRAAFHEGGGQREDRVQVDVDRLLRQAGAYVAMDGAEGGARAHDGRARAQGLAQDRLHAGAQADQFGDAGQHLLRDLGGQVAVHVVLAERGGDAGAEAVLVQQHAVSPGRQHQGGEDGGQ